MLVFLFGALWLFGIIIYFKLVSAKLKYICDFITNIKFGLLQFGLKRCIWGILFCERSGFIYENVLSKSKKDRRNICLSRV